MKFKLSFILLSLLSTNTFSQSIVRDSIKPIGSFGLISPLTQPSDNIPFINLTIKNKESIFILDTGAGSSFIDENQAKQFDIQIEFDNDNGVLNGIGGDTYIKSVINVDTIQINNKKFSIKLRSTNLKNIVDLVQSKTELQILGILGSDFLEEHKAIIDFNRNIIILRTDTTTIIRRRRR